MKVTTEPGALAAAVKFAARALTARAAYPILGGLKITASPGGGVEVAAFDHETSARAAHHRRRGRARHRAGARAACWPLSPPELPRQPVELASDGAALTLTAGRTRYTLRLLPADEYPALPELPAPAGQADAGEFAAAVRQVVVAASRDDTLPALCAVQVTFTAGRVTMVATDRYRAAVRHLPWQPSGPAAAAGPDPRPGPRRRGPGRRPATRSGCTC